MKKWTKMIGMGVLALGVSLAAKTGVCAAQISNVTQTDGGTTSVRIQWDADLSASRYQYTITDGVTTKTDDTSSANTTIFSLTAGKTYTFSVTGYNSSGSVVAEESAPIQVTTAPNTDNFEVSQTDASTSSITVTGTGAVGADYYIVKSGDTTLAEGTSSTVKVTGLTANTKYDLRVYAARKSASGYLSYEDYSYKTIYSARTLSNALKTSEFGVSNVFYYSNVYYFAVNGANNASGYQLQFQNMKGKTKKTVTTTNMSSTNISNFINGHFYRYRVRSYAVCGTKNVYSKWSGFRYVGIVPDLSGKMVNGSIRLSWNKVSDAKKYIVYASTKEKSGFKKIKTLSSSKKSLTVSKVNGKKIKRGTTYYFRIVTYSKSGKKLVKSEIYNTYSGRVI